MNNTGPESTVPPAASGGGGGRLRRPGADAGEARARIGISLLTLVPGVVGGSETYARELTSALARVGELDYAALVPAIAPDAADGLPARVVPEYRASTTTAGRVAAMSRAWLRPRRLRRAVGLATFDAVHFPLTVTLPSPAGRPPAAVTVHDLQHELFPRFFSRAELAYRRLLYKHAVMSSRIVIAISAHARETLLVRYGIDPSRVVAIPLGVDHRRLTPGTRPREPFLLYPANPWPHKNHARLYEAFALARRTRPELRLVLTGSGHATTLPEGVESRGRVSSEELVELYRTASALVFPSLYEGFGLPPLEAMACGCPVASSSATSLPEVCGDAAELFDPRSPADMARAIEAVLDDPAPYTVRGLARAQQFSWEATAKAHDDVYRRLAAGE